MNKIMNTIKTISSPFTSSLTSSLTSTTYIIRTNTNSTHKCWRCGQLVSNKVSSMPQLFCLSCKTIQPFDKSRTHFQLYGLDNEYRINLSELKTKFRSIQNHIHPDKFGHKSEDEKNMSSEVSSLINKSYKILTDPYERGQYILELNGKSIKEDESDIHLDGDFLAEMMDFNEIIANADTKQRELNGLHNANSECIKRIINDITCAFENGDLDEAKKLLVKLKFYNNAQEKIKERLMT